MKTNITNLSKAKRKGLKVGTLRYISEMNSIPIISGFIKIKDKKHVSIPGFPNLCGYEFDRDVHAARNVKLFGSTKRAECLEQASAETLASVALDLSRTVS